MKCDVTREELAVGLNLPHEDIFQTKYSFRISRGSGLKLR